MTSEQKKEVKGEKGRVEKLSAKEEMFCLEYVKDSNGMQAAIRAGYSHKSACTLASRLLRKVNVRQRLGELREQAARKAGVTLQRVLDELSRVGFSNISDYLDFGPNGIKLKESVELNREVLACVAEVTETNTNRGKMLKFKLHDKVKALDSLKQYFVDAPSAGDGKKIIRLPLAFPQKDKK